MSAPAARRFSLSLVRGKERSGRKTCPPLRWETRRVAPLHRQSPAPWSYWLYRSRSRQRVDGIAFAAYSLFSQQQAQIALSACDQHRRALPMDWQGWGWSAKLNVDPHLKIEMWGTRVRAASLQSRCFQRWRLRLCCVRRRRHHRRTSGPRRWLCRRPRR